MAASRDPDGPLTEPFVEKKIKRTVLRLEHGDLTAMPVDAFVFYAREDLKLTSGFGTAIQSRGGDAVKKELASLGPLGMGEAVLTGAGKMKAKHIIHACGPKFQESDTETKLRRCVRSALALADRERLTSVAFPPMGAGFHGVPLALCATIMLETIGDFLRGETSLAEVTICVLDRREHAVFREKMEKL
ncbi:MAG: macro domain-containing protein [Candidatus Binataceae bacterium]